MYHILFKLQLLLKRRLRCNEAVKFLPRVVKMFLLKGNMFIFICFCRTAKGLKQSGRKLTQLLMNVGVDWVALLP